MTLDGCIVGASKLGLTARLRAGNYGTKTDNVKANNTTETQLLMQRNVTGQ